MVRHHATLAARRRAKECERMGEGRVFLRGITSEKYGLGELREAILGAPRVRGDEVVVDDASVGHSGDSQDSRTLWRLGPGDEPFLTQTLRVHFVELPPGTSNHGHGHQNETVFYILEGRGYPSGIWSRHRSSTRRAPSRPSRPATPFSGREGGGALWRRRRGAALAERLSRGRRPA